MPTAPSAIAASGAVPDPSDRTTFNTRAFSWDTWISGTLVGGINAALTNVYNNAVEAFNNAVAAAASAVLASNYATAAGSAGSAAMWVSGTTYNAGICVWSPTNKLTYRRNTTGAGTTDPVSDSTNWTLLNPVATNQVLQRAAYLRETFGGDLVSGNSYAIYTNAGALGMYLPTYANSVVGDQIICVNMWAYWATNAFTVNCHANVLLTKYDTPSAGTTDTSLVCNTNVPGFTLICSYKDGTNAYWSVVA